MRILQWNAGGPFQPKRVEILETLNTHDFDAFSIMDANLTNDNLKYYSFKGYFLFILTKFSQVASSILIGIKSGLTVYFLIVKNMERSFDMSEVVEINV